MRCHLWYWYWCHCLIGQLHHDWFLFSWVRHTAVQMEWQRHHMKYAKVPHWCLRGIGTIVMLKRFEHNGQAKCHKYYLDTWTCRWLYIVLHLWCKSRQSRSPDRVWLLNRTAVWCPIWSGKSSFISQCGWTLTIWSADYTVEDNRYEAIHATCSLSI